MEVGAVVELAEEAVLAVELEQMRALAPLLPGHQGQPHA